MTNSDTHVPVMLQRVVGVLAPALAEPGSVYVDCTTGLGGHARAILEHCPHARVVGLDRDADALAVAGERLAEFGNRVTLVQAVYDEIADVVADLGISGVQAILADLGLSSLQIDRRERGFAYSVDAPLDMRMDARSELTAANVVNTYSERDLARIFAVYGEEKFSSRIASKIVTARPFTTSAALVEVIAGAIPMAARATGGHPAKRVFQALRIEVNAELEALEAMIPAALDSLAVGGRFAVLAYHSLEDRLVKKAFAAASTNSAPRGLPVVPPEFQPKYRLLTRGAEMPTPEEITENSRAASARFRVVERTAR